MKAIFDRTGTGAMAGELRHLWLAHRLARLYEWRQKAAVKAKKLARAEQEGVSQVERG